MKETNLKYEAYTDGSCDNISPYGEGGSAYIILKDGVIIKESKKGFVGTTNNRMEMLAIISAVKSVPKGALLLCTLQYLKYPIIRMIIMAHS